MRFLVNYIILYDTLYFKGKEADSSAKTETIQEQALREMMWADKSITVKKLSKAVTSCMFNWERSGYPHKECVDVIQLALCYDY